MFASETQHIKTNIYTYDAVATRIKTNADVLVVTSF